MYSKKLESIHKSKSQALTTYLSEAHAKDSGHVTRREAARETGINERTVQTIFSQLTSSGILKAKIQVRCPHCNTQHGIYLRKSDVPTASKRCFDCGKEFKQNNRRSWEVIYEIANDPGDFFQGRKSISIRLPGGLNNWYGVSP
jgi:DNA-directed RNA polymerase subunit RPC12/RpoP